MARITLWLIGLGLLISISLVVGIYLLSQNETADFGGSAKILKLELDAGLKDMPGSGSLLDDPESLPPLTTEVSQMLLDASTDNAISGLHINLSSLNLGWAQVHEIRNSIKTFVDSGKPCTLHTDALSNKEYYLASACSDIHISPNGIFLVNGLSVTQSYYANLFEKLDISANFAHVGDFKSAVEPYERTGPSEAASEATNALLDSLFGQLQNSIAEGRNLLNEESIALLDDPPFTPQAAQESGLIDSLSYSDEILDPEADVIYSDRYLKKRRSAWQSNPNKIAIIHADGAIVSGDSGESMFGGQFVGDVSMKRYIRKAKDDDNIKAVVLRVNSPGGSGAASDIIWHELEELQAAGKSVVVSMGDYAASGGYYISMGSDFIFAQPNTITGSIGVFGGKINLSGLYDYAGVTQHTYKRGHFSTIFSEVHNFDDRQRAKYQDFLNGFYEVFITKAAEGRNLEKSVISINLEISFVTSVIPIVLYSV